MNAQLNQLETISPIAEYRPTEAALSELRQRYEAVVFDVTTGKGMEVAKKARAELRDYRVALEKKRVEIKEPALTRCREIDSEAKRITAELAALESPIDEQIKGEEQRKEREKLAREEAERERIAEINRRFDAIRALPMQANDATIEQIDAVLFRARAIDHETFPSDLQDSAKYERQLAINALMAVRDRREVADRERAELEQLRAQRDAMEAEQARLAQAERDRVAAAEQAERERQEAERIEQARQQAVADAEARRVREAAEAEQRQAAAVIAERQRIEQAHRDEAARIEREREKREANRRHVAAINRKAAEAMIAGGLDFDTADKVITLIADGQVPGVSIAY